MFCCLPLPRGRGLGRAHRQSVWDRWRRWLRAPRGGLWPFARRNRKSFPPDVADEGDTPSTSSREGSEPHPPAREAQCRVQVSVPMEGSAQGGVKSKRGRPPQKPPRTHRGAQSRAASRLSTPGSDPEPRAPLPLRQHEDLEPSAAEHREVLAARAGPRDPLRGHRDLIHPASKTLDQLVPGHHTGQIGPLCRQDAQPQAPMSQEELRVHTGNGRSQPLGSAAPSSSGWRLCPDGSWKATNGPRPTSLPFHCWSLTTASRTPSGRTRAPLPLDARVKPGPGS
ncbi:uncharacterized protein LOC122685236 [Cervus elaphus]|uniref:uncharacterized protein LOC122685236 n=1 Tax=Cervus elaphus TaxID=9860 RepID=UPI001CC287F7|nr:uncharacterized protein LOC122685236 [Cervus elaphus]